MNAYLPVARQPALDYWRTLTKAAVPQYPLAEYGLLSILNKDEHGLEPDDPDELIVAGYASPQVVDQQRHLITKEALAADLPRFLANPKYRNANLMHLNIQVGEVLPVWRHPRTGEVFTTKVDDVGLFAVVRIRTDRDRPPVMDEVIRDIKNGKLACFSISADAPFDSRRYVCKDGTCFYIIDRIFYYEFTICQKPVNQDAKFTILNKARTPALDLAQQYRASSYCTAGQCPVDPFAVYARTAQPSQLERKYTRLLKAQTTGAAPLPNPGSTDSRSLQPYQVPSTYRRRPGQTDLYFYPDFEDTDSDRDWAQRVKDLQQRSARYSQLRRADPDPLQRQAPDPLHPTGKPSPDPTHFPLADAQQPDSSPPVDMDPKEFELGLKHEATEHIDTVGGDYAKLAEFVKNHLQEDPHYYSRRKAQIDEAAPAAATTPPPEQAAAPAALGFEQLFDRFYRQAQLKPTTLDRATPTADDGPPTAGAGQPNTPAARDQQLNRNRPVPSFSTHTGSGPLIRKTVQRDAAGRISQIIEELTEPAPVPAARTQIIRKSVERDADGRITGIAEERIDG